MGPPPGRANVDAHAPTDFASGLHDRPDSAICVPGMVVAGQYTVRGLLGEGGMGEVYLVEHRTLRAEFALKILKPAFRRRPDIVQRFQDEGRALWELKHPNFVQVHHAGDDPQIGPFIAMEVLRGKTLAQLLHVMGKLSIEHALPIAIEVAETAQAMHEQGILHRDLKPENIFLTVRERTSGMGRGVKLLDLGAAKIAKYGGPATEENRTIGTGKYMSPEHIRCKPLTPASDVYALAHIVFEMIAGTHCFGAAHPNPSHYDFQIWHLNADPDSLVSRLPNAPAELSTILAKGMAKLPAERYESMAAFATALRETLRNYLVAKAAGATSRLSSPPSIEAKTIEDVLSSKSPDGRWSMPSFGAQSGVQPAAITAQGATTEADTTKDPLPPGEGEPTNTRRLPDAARPSAVARLVVQKGPTPGHSYALAPQTYVVGRQADVDIYINDDSLSAHHARVVVHPSGITEVHDEGSTNGLAVNDKPIPYAVLKHGDILRLGAVTLEFLLEDHERHEASPFGGTMRMESPIPRAPQAGAPDIRTMMSVVTAPGQSAAPAVAAALAASPGSRGTARMNAVLAQPPAPTPTTPHAPLNFGDAPSFGTQPMHYTPQAPVRTIEPTPPMGTASVRLPQQARPRRLRWVVLAVVVGCLLIGGVALARQQGWLG
ncbi:MAG: FHA domain-containing serine/threonine-protein kinase [Polyangiaceae bacterium]